MRETIGTQPTRKGELHSLKVVVAIIACLVFTGTAAASVASEIAWTTKDARAAAVALAYPKPHAKKVTCRKLGAAFKCDAVYRRGHRTFVLAPGTEGGWTCAGHTLHTCHVLAKGFLSSTQVTSMGGLEAAATYSSTGYIQEHYSGTTPQQVGSCHPFGTSGFSCSYSTPDVTVGITYKKVKGGWTVTGATS